MARAVRCLFLVVSVLLVSLQTPARGDSFIYEFSDVFSGFPPDSTPPWLVSQFSSTAPGSVEMVVTANLTANESLRYLYFNLNDAYNPKHLNFQILGGTGAYTAPVFDTGKNQFKAGGDGRYDLLLSFSMSGNSLVRFTQGDSIRIAVTGIADLTENDFKYLSQSAGGHGPFFAAGHIQSIGTANESGWVYAEQPTMVPVPEPASASLFGLAACIMLLTRSWKVRR